MYNNNMVNFDIIFLLIFFVLFCLFCRFEWKLYCKGREQLKALYKKHSEDYNAFQSKASVDKTIASKEILQSIKKTQLDQKIRDEHNQSNES